VAFRLFKQVGTFVVLMLCVLLSCGGLAISQEKINLVMWDEFAAEPEFGAMQQIVDTFQEQNPEISIKRVTMDMEAMRQVLVTSIGAGVGPDIFYTGTGWGGVGPLIGAGLIYDLTQAYKTRGWKDHVLQWGIDFVTYGDKVWSVPYEVEVAGIFYHEDIFEELGLDLSGTYDDFLRVAKVLKDKGYTPPVSTAARPSYVIGWLENSIIAAIVPDAVLKKVVLEYGSWDQPIFVEVYKRMKELHDKEYIPKDVLALNYDDMSMLFFNKKAPMCITGSWIVPQIEETYPDLRVAFSPVPPLAGVEKRATKNIGGAFHVSSNTKNIEAVLKFLDHVLNKDSADIWFSKAKLIAPIKDLNPEEFEISSLRRQVLEILQEPLAMFMLFNILPSDVNNETWNAIQGMWMGEKTPEEVAKIKQDLWAKAIEEGRVAR